MNKTDRKSMLNPPKGEFGELAPYNSLRFFLENGAPESIFIEQYIKAIEESGISPKEFAKINKIDSERLFKFYKDIFVEAAFLTHNVDSYHYLIVNGSKMVKLHDFLGVKIKTMKSPLFLGEHPFFEEDIQQALMLCSDEEFQNFARLFSTKPKGWFKTETGAIFGVKD